MTHIFIIGYLFVTVLFSAAQPGIERALIYFLFWSVLPTAFFFWARSVRRRNKLMKLQEKQQVKNENE
ncbi:hypothetical protein [Neisseria weaveri]|uniref:hypothetical protein n=1 Tax=Neisseria weaveri TaxID=28091 RepID=UPI0007C9BF7D|nr:hypothetical protein [Neisseria weaveri]SAY51638.1 integral membrane protein [Neisseria weaveri]